MTQKPENPPAFPFEYEESSSPNFNYRTAHQGMTLRDYFAGQALIGILSLGKEACLSLETGGGLVVADAIAENAYFQADAMLKARG